MTTEKITLYRVSDDKTEVIEQLPKTVASQVYDDVNGKFLPDTLKMHAEYISQIALSLDLFPKLSGEVDDTLRIQRAINYAQLNNYETVMFPPGSYVSSSTIHLKSGVGISGYGASLSLTSAPTIIIECESNTFINGLEVIGFGNSALNYSSMGICITGSDSSNYLSNVSLTNVRVKNIGGMAICMEYAKDIIINDIYIENVGYAGIHGFSVTNVSVRNPHIKNISPGTGSISYGVTFSRRGNTDSLITYPRSSHCEVVGGVIENNPVWVALDTHGGEYILFKDTVIKNCKAGVGIVPSHLNNVHDHAPNYCTVSGIRMYGTGADSGIIISGAGTSSSLLEHSVGCSIINCHVENYGMSGNSTNGAIRLVNTIGCSVSNNTIKDSKAIALCIYYNNLGFNISGNVIVNTTDNTFTNPTGIGVRDSNNQGYIGANSLIKNGTTSDAYHSVWGIALFSKTNVDVTMGNNYNTFTTPLYDVRGNEVKILNIGSASNFYTGVGSPEGIITASIGSLYLAQDATSGILFVKETGSGNTGWVLK